MSAVPFFNVFDAVIELKLVAVLMIASVSRLLRRPIFGKHSNASANVLCSHSEFAQKYFRLLITISAFLS
jgi:hypothetical protein